jgi:SH3-like domain-containing protein
MRSPVRVFLALALLPAIGGGAQGQSPASSDTLRVPTHPPRVQSVKPPAAAPRRPVHRVEEAKTPVVRAHGPIQPHRPATVAVPGKAPPAASSAVPAQPKTENPKPEAKASPPTKLPDPETPEGGPVKLPRFVSLRSDEVNMRVGPGTKYPIEWVYKRRDLPVEIERQFEVWRWVRDADGIQGWVHEATLMGRRSFIVQKADATMRSAANDTASAVAILKPGVIGRIRSCEAASDWCEVQTGSYRGYLRREQFWGTLPDEGINP